MKRIVAAIILLSLSITVAFASNFYITKKIEEITSALGELVDGMSSASSEEINEKSKKIITEWEKNEWIFHSFIASDFLNEAEKSIEILPEIAKYEINDEFRVFYINAYNAINALYEAEKISKENIF